MRGNRGIRRARRQCGGDIRVRGALIGGAGPAMLGGVLGWGAIQRSRYGDRRVREVVLPVVGRHPVGDWRSAMGSRVARIRAPRPRRSGA